MKYMCSACSKPQDYGDMSDSSVEVWVDLPFYTITIIAPTCAHAQAFIHHFASVWNSDIKGKGLSIIVDIFLYDNSYRKRGEWVEKCW